jgi:hypothetical protein
VFQWVCWDEDAKGKGGWDRKIGYTPKEYRLLAEKVGRVVERLGVRALDAEMVGYVLGKEKIDVEADASDMMQSREKDPEDSKVDEKKTETKEKSGSKRARKPENSDEAKGKPKKKRAK